MMSRYFPLMLMYATVSGSRLVAQSPPEATEVPVKSPAEIQAEERKLVERILEKTKAARDKLVEKATTIPTQEDQKTVVKDLEQLIELLKTSPPPSSDGSGSSPPPQSQNPSSSQDQQSNSQQQPQSSRGSPSSGSGTGANRENPQDSEERQGESHAEKMLADRKRRLETDIWGHLPPALREQLLNTYGERMLPQYEDFVRKFYEALSEPQRTTKRP